MNRQAGRARQSTASVATVAAMCGCVVGVVATVAFIRFFPQLIDRAREPAVTVVRGDEPVAVTTRPSPVETPPAVSPPAAVSPSRIDDVPALGPNPAGELRGRSLDVPVKGASRADLRDTFDERRGGTRVHEAIDILAPRNTPIVAVENGKIAKLFTSKAGGITVYQFDPGSEYVYYYAHLERYAAGLKEGATVQRGQLLGYVGTSGNAPKDTPHLHFAIFVMTDKKQWWQGTPLDPYEILK